MKALLADEHELTMIDAGEQASDAEWKKFEKLVARLEQALASSNVEVRSPDKLPDKETGALREVDASIRCRVGSTEVLIILEARKRGRAQDVTWVEQLATKKHRLGASAIVAVTDKPLTKEAQLVAELERIETRTLEESQLPGFLTWISGQFVGSSRVIMRNIVRANATLWEPDPAATLLTPTNGPIDGATPNTPMFVFDDGTMISANHILELGEKQGIRFGEGFKDREVRHQHFTLPFVDRGICVNTALGFRPVKSVTIVCRVEVQETKIVPNLVRYTSGDGMATEAAEIQLPGTGLGVMLIRNAKTGQTSAHLVAQGAELIAAPALQKLANYVPQKPAGGPDLTSLPT